MIEKDEAIVIRSVDFSETSLILTLFTKRFGKIDALAKGGRRLKSSFESALDILSQISVTFLHKKRDVLDLLTESKLIKRFHVTSDNLSGLYGAYYVADLLNLFTEPDAPNEKLFNIAAQTLVQLEQAHSVNYFVARFEYNIMQENGTQPTLHICAECGSNIDNKNVDNKNIDSVNNDNANVDGMNVGDANVGGLNIAMAGQPQKVRRTNARERIPFSFLSGGVICDNCAEKMRNNGQMYKPITPFALDMLQHFANENTTKNNETENVKNITELNDNTMLEILNLTNNCINHQLGTRPRTQKWLQKNYPE
ncbi:MAG: DNA repair protein RecO [Planctomycetaceae bacterium]|jgi:DNA repair protein RecO|nr:DNA repair protein RecO [Planctomycetaceae bacterium]